MGVKYLGSSVPRYGVGQAVIRVPSANPTNPPPPYGGIPGGRHDRIISKIHSIYLWEMQYDLFSLRGEGPY